MSSIRKSWLLAVCFGVLVAVLSQVMMPMFPKEGAGYASGLGTPVFAFEMATTRDDLIKVFGGEDDPAREERITAMDRGNRWDYVFMIAYGSFLWTFFRAVRWESDWRFWWLFAGLGLVAAVADAIENVLLLRLTGDLETARHLEWLAYPVWTKFLLLMLTSLAAGSYLIQRRHWLWTTLGLLTICGGLTVLVARWSPESYAHLIGHGITVAWVIQLVYAITRSIRPHHE